MSDPINHPAHYNQGGIETFDYIHSNGFGYAQGNVIKYVSRYKLKGAPLEDLKKARWYLDKLIAEEAGKLNTQVHPAIRDRG